MQEMDVPPSDPSGWWIDVRRLGSRIAAALRALAAGGSLLIPSWIANGLAMISLVLSSCDLLRLCSDRDRRGRRVKREKCGEGPPSCTSSATFGDAGSSARRSAARAASAAGAGRSGTGMREGIHGRGCGKVSMAEFFDGSKEEDDM